MLQRKLNWHFILIINERGISMKIALFADTYLPQINGVTNTLNKLIQYYDSMGIQYKISTKYLYQNIIWRYLMKILNNSIALDSFYILSPELPF